MEARQQPLRGASILDYLACSASFEAEDMAKDDLRALFPDAKPRGEALMQGVLPATRRTPPDPAFRHAAPSVAGSRNWGNTSVSA